MNKTLKELLQISSQEHSGLIQEIEGLQETYGEPSAEHQAFEETVYKKLIEKVKGKKYFDCSDVDHTGLDYDTCIVATAKNSGKTTAIYRKIQSLIEQGIKFIYMRGTLTELQAAKDHFCFDRWSTCVMVKSSDRFYFYSKKDYEEILAQLKEKKPNDIVRPIPTKQLFDKYGYDFVGIAVEFVKANWKLGGGDFAGFETIIFDEFTTSGEQQKYKPEHMTQWTTFLSTVIRQKKHFKVYMYGNIRKNNKEILNLYGIRVFDKLRYFEQGLDAGQKSQVLFINFDQVYGASYKNQHALTQTGDPETILELKRNKPVETISAIMPYFSHEELNDDIVIAFGDINDIFLLESKYWEEEEKESFGTLTTRKYVVQISKTSQTGILLLNKKVYSPSAELAYLKGIYYHDRAFRDIDYLFIRYINKTLHFADSQSLHNFQVLTDNYYKANKRSLI